MIDGPTSGWMIIGMTVRSPAPPKPHLQHFLRLISLGVTKARVCLMRLMDGQGMALASLIYCNERRALRRRDKSKKLRKSAEKMAYIEKKKNMCLH